MQKNKEITKIDFNTSNVIMDTISSLTEGVTGIATSSKNDLILSVSHIFQRIRSGHFLSQLLEEWENYKEKGKVKEDYQYTEQHKACLQELLDFIDKDSPDDVRFKLLKKIFLISATETASDRNSIIPQQFMKIARSLSSGEVVLLKAFSKLGKDHNYNFVERDDISPKSYLDESGLGYQELFDIYYEDLRKKGFLPNRERVKDNYWLTGLGVAFCSFIENYDE